MAPCLASSLRILASLPLPGDAVPSRHCPNGKLERLALRDPAHVALARKFVADRGLDNVEVVQSDARANLAAESFDLVHARLLLVNIPSPEQVVAEMVRLVNPGRGSSPTRRTAQPAYASRRMQRGQLNEVLEAAYRSDGADLSVGRKLSGHAAGGRAGRCRRRARADVYPAGHPRRTIMADLVRSMRDKIVERGIAAENELARVDRAVREHLAAPETLTMSCLYFLAWGRKPMADGRHG